MALTDILSRSCMSSKIAILVIIALLLIIFAAIFSSDGADREIALTIGLMITVGSMLLFGSYLGYKLFMSLKQ
jgi:hypothetical protein